MECRWPKQTVGQRTDPILMYPRMQRGCPSLIVVSNDELLSMIQGLGSAYHCGICVVAT